MNTSTAFNQIGSKGPGSQSFSLFESISLLNECRDVAAEWLAGSLDSMLAQLEEALLEEAERTIGRQSSTLMECREVVQARRKDIQAHFRRRFVETFNRKINTRPQETSTFGKLPTGEMELSLVANDDYDEILTVDEINKRIKQSSVAELNALDQRLGLLMQREVDDRDNPLGPSAITDAFKFACEDLELPGEVRRVMLDKFNTRFVNVVPEFYQNINQHLVTRNVMPVISTLPRRPHNQSPAPSQKPAAPQPQQAPLAAQDLSRAMEQGDWQQVLGQLFARAGMSGGPAPAGLPGHQASAMAGHSANLFDELTRLQQQQMLVGASNILRELKSGGLAEASSGNDGVTIDIVAMLFDYIFDDANIPASIKALIGRLQIPVLKVAILDSRFFSRKTHPARRLLDTLASASIGLADDDANCQRLQAKVAEVVQYIVTSFEEDLGVFNEAQQRLEAFMAEEERLAAEAAAKTAKAIYERERLDLARVMAVEELQERASAEYVAEEMREFFRKHWSEYAARCYLHSGEQGEAWRGALLVVDELVWSVAPKVSVEERMRLVTLLPDLLKRLEKGVALIKLAQEEKEAFFSLLVKLHAQAIKAGVKASSELKPVRTAAPAAAPVAATPAAAPVAAPVSPIKAQLKELDSRGFDPLAGSLAAAATGASAPAATAASPSVPAEAPASKAKAGVAQLKRGSLVEFTTRQGKTILKLAWVSPLKGVFLFTNRNGQNAVSIDKLDIEGMLAHGQARLVDETALFDRAMTTMVSQLQTSQ